MARSRAAASLHPGSVAAIRARLASERGWELVVAWGSAMARARGP
jgi:hypothetical protein